jgi:hypothetical protein
MVTAADYYIGNASVRDYIPFNPPGIVSHFSEKSPAEKVSMADRIVRFNKLSRGHFQLIYIDEAITCQAINPQEIPTMLSSAKKVACFAFLLSGVSLARGTWLAADAYRKYIIFTKSSLCVRIFMIAVMGYLSFEALKTGLNEARFPQQLDSDLHWEGMPNNRLTLQQVLDARKQLLEHPPQELNKICSSESLPMRALLSLQEREALFAQEMTLFAEKLKAAWPFWQGIQNGSTEEAASQLSAAKAVLSQIELNNLILEQNALFKLKEHSVSIGLRPLSKNPTVSQVDELCDWLRTYFPTYFPKS